MRFTAVYQQVPEGGYVAWVEELPGAHTQAETLDEARSLLAEAVTLVLEANRDIVEKDIATRKVIKEELVVTS
jgi:predicted RNase H-like HicB family nuclease